MKRIRLKAARLRANLTQVELAARAGVTQPTISKLEQRRVQHPRLDVALRIAGALGLNPAQLDFSAPHKEVSA